MTKLLIVLMAAAGAMAATPVQSAAMTKEALLVILLASAGAVAATPAMSTTMSKAEYNTALQRIDETFKSDKEQCKPLKANTKDICVAEANARQRITKAEARADYLGTVKTRTAARIARADVEYRAALERCDAYSGDGKNRCVKDAKGQFGKS